MIDKAQPDTVSGSLLFKRMAIIGYQSARGAASRFTGFHNPSVLAIDRQIAGIGSHANAPAYLGSQKRWHDRGVTADVERCRAIVAVYFDGICRRGFRPPVQAATPSPTFFIGRSFLPSPRSDCYRERTSSRTGLSPAGTSTYARRSTYHVLL